MFNARITTLRFEDKIGLRPQGKVNATPTYLVPTGKALLNL
jgi:hypothetical protein